MNAPPVQYATTVDGVGIAHTSFGEGAPVVFAAGVWGDIETYSLPRHHTRRHTDPLVAAGCQVVRYDPRGFGSSDRDVSDFSLDARIHDLEAVLTARGLTRHVLAARDVGTVTAIAYAARNPESVSQLVLFNPWASGAERYGSIVAAQALVSLKDVAIQDWRLGTMAIANLETTFDDPASAAEMARVYRGSTSPQTWLSCRLASEQIDVSDLLPLVAAPTLVLHERPYRFTSFELCRHVAASITGSRFVSADYDPVMESVLAFLQAPDSGGSQSESGASLAGRESEDGLSSRELEVLRLLAAGKSNQQIADELVISLNTVNRHVSNIYAKTGAANRAEAATYAARNGIT
jgi:DNA-binding NarL/FixJ family response regulator